jgi:hypothetical protein
MVGCCLSSYARLIKYVFFWCCSVKWNRRLVAHRVVPSLARAENFAAAAILDSRVGSAILKFG